MVTKTPKLWSCRPSKMSWKTNSQGRIFWTGQIAWILGWGLEKNLGFVKLLILIFTCWILYHNYYIYNNHNISNGKYKHLMIDLRPQYFALEYLSLQIKKFNPHRILTRIGNSRSWNRICSARFRILQSTQSCTLSTYQKFSAISLQTRSIFSTNPDLKTIQLEINTRRKIRLKLFRTRWADKTYFIYSDFSFRMWTYF